jgi:hypothetical protein
MLKFEELSPDIAAWFEQQLESAAQYEAAIRKLVAEGRLVLTVKALPRFEEARAWAIGRERERLARLAGGAN